MPISCLYRQARWSVTKTLANIVIAPFGRVRFRHFFLADVVTSMITPIQQTTIIYCYFVGPEHNWEEGTTVSFARECIVASKFKIFLGFIPYWFRFWQCLHKYWDSKQRIHLVNAGKYFSDMLVPIAGIWFLPSDFDNAFWIYAALHFWASTYSYCWDIYMDWGLLRCWKREKYALRDKINYPVWFYYFSMVVDLVLRYTWILTLWTLGHPDTFYTDF